MKSLLVETPYDPVFAESEDETGEGGDNGDLAGERAEDGATGIFFKKITMIIIIIR